MAPKKQNQRPQSSRVVPVPTRDELAAFWEKVDRSGGPDACWLWTGSLDDDGYGKAGYQGEMWAPHQLSWVFSGMLKPSGLEIDHRCRTRDCCNPAHMRLSTREGNAAGTGESSQRYEDLDAILRRWIIARREHGEWFPEKVAREVLGLSDKGGRFRERFARGYYGRFDYITSNGRRVRAVNADALADHAYRLAFSDVFAPYKALFNYALIPETLDYHAEMTAVLADYNAADGAA